MSGDQQPNDIHTRLNAAMRAIGAIGKDQVNTGQHFKFRGIDQAMNACHTVFAEQGIFVTKTILDSASADISTKSGATMHTITLHVRYRFMAVDGSFVETDSVGIGYDTGDKHANKAMSIALKYALFEILMVPTELQDDPDATIPEETKPPRKARKTSKKSAAEEMVNPSDKPGLPAPAKPGPESAAPTKELAKGARIAGVVKAVSSKEGPSGKSRFGIKLDGGDDWHNTFSESAAKVAYEAKDNGRAVWITYDEREWAEKVYRDLTAIEYVEETT